MRICFLVSAAILLSACTSKNINGENDKIAAQAVASDFYQKCKRMDYSSIRNVFDERIPGETFGKIEQYLAEKDSILGAFQWASLQDYHTYTESGLGNPTVGRYDLRYQVCYERDTTDEIFIMELDKKSDSIKILNYTFSSPKYKF